MDTTKRAWLKVVTHEDQSENFDVMIIDDAAGPIPVEVNCISARDADELMKILRRGNFEIGENEYYRY